ncbi:transposase, partial [Micromonospora sp. GCM10011541]
MRCADLQPGQTSRAGTRHRRRAGRTRPPGHRPHRRDHHPRPAGGTHRPESGTPHHGLVRRRPRGRRPAAHHRRRQPRPAALRSRLAHLCGAAPIPASSGRVRRHRLHRGGDRGANHALHTIALCRMRYDQRTQAYVHRRITEGLSKQEILRCLKRYIVR